MGLTNALKATSGSAPGDAVISTGQRATVGSAYTLDGVGNRTDVDLAEPLIPGFETGTINYTYNMGNILATADTVSYTHDANGNRTQKVAGAVTVDYTYDPLNRLTQVADGTQTIQYIYNGLGQRVGKIEDGVQTNYLIDPNGALPQVLAEMDVNGDLLAFYVYDGVGLVAKVTPENAYYFYHYDGLGNTVAITDSSGVIVNAYAYSPYGLVGGQETIPNSFTYVGRFGVMAESHGLYFMRARYYDPEVGRFINKDPIGYAGELNLFAYVKNNPVRFVDPLGLFSFDISDRYKFDSSKVDWWKVAIGAAILKGSEMIIGVGVVVIIFAAPEGIIYGGMITATGVIIWTKGLESIIEGGKKGIIIKEKPCQ